MANPDTPSVVETIDPNIPVAAGYYCETREDLVQAYKILGEKDAIIKPARSGAGVGLMVRTGGLITGCSRETCSRF
jgi:hypothetical protein